MTHADDAHRQSFEIALRALAQVKQHQTSADPVAYEVWYEHVAGRHGKLSADLKGRADRGRVTDVDVRELHANHLSSLRVSERIEEIGAGAHTEMEGLRTALDAAGDNLSAVNTALQRTAERLDVPDLTAGGLRALVEAALSTTREACSTNAALRARVAETEGSIEALQSALAEARGDALTDSLTSLSNRRGFDEQYKLRFDRASAGALPLSLFILDIDHFKTFNDTYGHTTGDQVIRLVGSCIQQRLGPRDLPARYGGEEFAIISLGRPISDALAMAEDIRHVIDSYQIVQRGTKKSLGKVTVSIGVASLRPTDSMATLLERADGCLYDAKRGGRNRVSADVRRAA